MSNTEGPLRDLDDCLNRIVQTAPSESETLIRNLLRFLNGSLPDQLLEVDAWAESHWRKLRRNMPSDSKSRDAWIEIFFEEIYTAQEDTDADAQSKILMDAVKKAQPGRNELDRLRGQIVHELEHIPHHKHKAYLDDDGWRGNVTVGGSIEGQTWWTRREILHRSRGGSDRSIGLRREDGSGPRTAFDSPSERLMRFLTAENDPDTARTRVTRNTAARITADVLHWVVGGDRLSERALSERWRWLTEDPRRTPHQL